LAAGGQPPADLQGGITQQPKRDAHGEELALLADRVGALGAGQGALEPLALADRAASKRRPGATGRLRPPTGQLHLLGAGVIAADDLVGQQPQGELGQLGDGGVGELIAQRAVANSRW
jgi:hypothetical protein